MLGKPFTSGRIGEKPKPFPSNRRTERGANEGQNIFFRGHPRNGRASEISSVLGVELLKIILSQPAPSAAARRVRFGARKETDPKILSKILFV
jgi:hypothetical protein